MHIAALKALELAVYPSRAPLLAALQQDKALTKIPLEYANYANVFSPDLAMELPENTSINKHAIKLSEGKQPPYDPIYSLGPVELKMLKAYNETHLKTGLFGLLSLRQVHPSFLIKSLMEVYGYMLITKDSII